MSQTYSIGVMARAPLAGEAKTRLIPALGAEGAARLQRLLTQRALHTACAAAPGQVTLFTAGPAAHPFWRECVASTGVDVCAQQGEHLGARMHHALQHLLSMAERALLIGTDCPVLSIADLQTAGYALAAHRMVFTPAEDGGYVLVGARRCLPAVFAELPWGTEQVMHATRAAMEAEGWQAGRDWSELPTLWDVDYPQDLQRARNLGLLPAV